VSSKVVLNDSDPEDDTLTVMSVNEASLNGTTATISLPSGAVVTVNTAGE